MIDREKTGRRLSALRRAAGLTQAALAKRLCVSTQAVSKWETGGSVPDVALLLELSALYGVTVNALLGRKPPEDVSMTVRIGSLRHSGDCARKESFRSFPGCATPGRWSFPYA